MRSLLIAFLLLISAPAAAEWVKYVETPFATFYYDPATVKVDGNLRRMWMIADLRQRGKLGQQSDRITYEFDCKGEQSRVVSISSHSQPMGGGTIIGSGNPPTEWQRIPSTSSDTILLKAACAALHSTLAAADGMKDHPAPAPTKWMKYAEDDAMIYYYDPITVEVDSHLRRGRALMDLKQRGAAGVMSVITRMEYDCKEERGRILSSSTHSESMSSGNTLSSSHIPQDWTDIVPNSKSAYVFNVLCERR